MHFVRLVWNLKGVTRAPFECPKLFWWGVFSKGTEMGIPKQGTSRI